MIDALSHPWAVWTLVAVGCGFIEILVPYFAFVFACSGALVAAVVAIFFPWEIQFLSFALTVFLSIIFFRPRLLQRFQRHHHMPSRTGTLLGSEGEVTAAVNPAQNSGRVLVQGQDWAAQSEQSLSIGQKIVVTGSDGIVLIVKEL
jgi:membrane protein implicated in regulation of membrane protease activity